MNLFTVRAAWDTEAGVWYVEDSDVPGLAAEGETTEALIEKLSVLIPELLEMNRHLLDFEPGIDIPVHLIAERTVHLAGRR